MHIEDIGDMTSSLIETELWEKNRTWEFMTAEFVKEEEVIQKS